jgi:hypothetical protein
MSMGKVLGGGSSVNANSSGYIDLALLGERFHVIEPERWNKMFSRQVSSAATPVSLESLAREKMSQNHIHVRRIPVVLADLSEASDDGTFGSRGCRIGRLKVNRRLSGQRRRHEHQLQADNFVFCIRCTRQHTRVRKADDVC